MVNERIDRSHVRLSVDERLNRHIKLSFLEPIEGLSCNVCRLNLKTGRRTFFSGVKNGVDWQLISRVFFHTNFRNVIEGIEYVDYWKYNKFGIFTLNEKYLKLYEEQKDLILSLDPYSPIFLSSNYENKRENSTDS